MEADLNERSVDMPLLLQLFLTFAKIGLFTFGGGYAMLSIIEHSCVEEKKWITHDEMMDVTVIAESTPGPIAINCATFVGQKQAGVKGAVVATFGMVLPSFLVILAIAAFLDRFLEITWVTGAFKGIKLAVGLLILDAAVTMLKKMQKKLLPRAIMLGSAVLMLCINVFSLRFSSILVMLLAGVVSISIFLASQGKQKGGEGK